MKIFSCIAAADEEEYASRYKLFNMLGGTLKSKIIPRMPGFISGSVQYMGVPGLTTLGHRICIPSKSDAVLAGNKLIKAVGRSRKIGAGVVVLEGKISDDFVYKKIEEKYKIKISRGIIYRPAVFIDAAKSISGIMRIDFKRCNICIADAASEMGLIMTELLLNDAAYLTLCTYDKLTISENTKKYIRRCGLSPAVVSSLRNAMKSCDILVYTGGMDINALISFSTKRHPDWNQSTGCL